MDSELMQVFFSRLLAASTKFFWFVSLSFEVSSATYKLYKHVPCRVAHM